MKCENGGDKKDMENSEEVVLQPVNVQSTNATSNVVGSSPAQINLDTLQDNLGKCLNIIDDEVMKGYVTRLNQLSIIEPEKTLDESMDDIQFFRITELVYQEDEFSVDKLAMVYQALSNSPCTLALMLKSDGERTEFYLGARPYGDKSSGNLRQMFEQSLLGFFPGSRISNYYNEQLKKSIDSLDVQCISSVTCIADYKQNEEALSNKGFIQGLEKFVYTMQGKKYTAILIADSVGHDDLMRRKREYEQIYTQVSPFVNMQMNFTVSDGGSSSVGNSEGTSTSLSRTQTQGTATSSTDSRSQTTGSSETVGRSDTDSINHTVSESDSDGRTHTDSKSDGTSNSTTNGANFGAFSSVNMPVGITVGYSHSSTKGTSHTDSVSDSVMKTLTHGLSDSYGHSHGTSSSQGINESKSVSQSTGISNSNSISETSGESFNLVNTKTMTDTFGTSKGITLNAQNMTLNSELQRIKKHLERIEECESCGMWNFAAYFLGESIAETEMAANTYKAVIAGTDSGIERSAVNSWTDERQVRDLYAYIGNFVHPQFLYRGFSYDEERLLSVNPSALVSTMELAIHMGLPRHSVVGLPVIQHAPFAQEVITGKVSEGKKAEVGCIYNLGQKMDTRMKLDIDSLTMHTFVTGSTGSGKSNTIYKLLGELKKKDIPFLVIEPAKGEYKDVLGKEGDVATFGTNPNLKDIQMLRINPFRFPEHTHILEHLDRLIEIFNVCWPMYAAMPAILKDSVERAYVSCGWNLEKSINKYDNNLFPTFRDVVKQIKMVLQESDYSDDNKGDYTGSLVTRLRSLTNGINGLIFTSDDLDDSELFDKNAIVDLSRVGSTETKSLIMGLLVLKLQEHRMEQRSNGANANDMLKHITVLEEAHNLLKRTSTEQSGENANMLGKSVEMLANSIAEMRTYGEGFVIADQAPGLLDMSVIRNTNTKIILRLPDFSDRELVGKAAGLNENQIVELAKLEKGVAAIYQNDWLEPVLCKIDKYKSYNLSQLSDASDQLESLQHIDNEKVTSTLLECIMNKEIYRKGDKIDLQRLRKDIIRSKLDTSVKCDFIDYLSQEGEQVVKSLRKLVYDFLNAEDAIADSKKCDDIGMWVHSVVEKLNPSITEYSREQIDLITALLIYEQSVRDEEYGDILCRFTEIYQAEGGVF